MLSSMETPLGLTIIGPEGNALRLQANSPAFKAGKQLLNQAMPAEQVWVKLNELLANPLQALVAWCAKFGVRMAEEGDILRLQDASLDKGQWLPLLQRSHLAGASPAPILRFAEALGVKAQGAPVSDVCLHWQAVAGGKAHHIGVVRSCSIPVDARVGDKVRGAVSGPHAGLVSFTDFAVDEDGKLQLTNGKVIAKFGTAAQLAADIACEPVILGFNRTYRCDEGTADGWLEDMSFDSLKAATRNAREIQASGAEARIINRITNEVVAIN